MADLTQKIEFKLNGKRIKICDNPLRRLLDVLRDELDLTGTKEGCSEGECGACSVLLNGKIVTSCLIPLGAVANQEVVTIEGIKETKLGKIIVDSFAEKGAVQCGFCIPAMVVAAYCLLTENHKPTESDVRKAISGNICRCTGYDLIVKAILDAAKKGSVLWTK